MRAFVGTSGYSYPEWRGSFYPEKLRTKEMLRFYATRLSSVEVNNTFYRMPRKQVIETWKADVPPDFRFCLKATRRITHFKKLRGTAGLLEYVVPGLLQLGENLGPVLFQLPPTMKADHGLLADFLDELRRAESTDQDKSAEATSLLRCALEFRHPSWFSDATLQILESKGAALVGGDLDEEPKAPPFVRTTDFLYLRLRKSEYENAEIEAWAEKINQSGVSSVHAYFKHEQLGPELAKHLEGLLLGSTTESREP